MTAPPPETFLFGYGRALLLTLLAFHVVHALTVNHREGGLGRRFVWLTVLTQSPLFLVAFAYGLAADAYSRQLVSPVYIGLGLVAGHLIFGLSLLATHRSPSDAWSLFWDFRSIWSYTVDYPVILTRYIGVAVGEEIIWRLAAQTELVRITGSAWLGIALVAVLFSVVHKHFFRNSFGVSAEFLVFALTLGVLYHWTHSLILVIVIHAVRDIEIAYLEFLVKVEEIGDSELAAREVVKGFFKRHPESV